MSRFFTIFWAFLFLSMDFSPILAATAESLPSEVDPEALRLSPYAGWGHEMLQSFNCCYRPPHERARTIPLNTRVCVGSALLAATLIPYGIIYGIIPANNTPWTTGTAQKLNKKTGETETWTYSYQSYSTSTNFGLAGLGFGLAASTITLVTLGVGIYYLRNPSLLNSFAHRNDDHQPPARRTIAPVTTSFREGEVTSPTPGIRTVEVNISNLLEMPECAICTDENARAIQSAVMLEGCVCNPRQPICIPCANNITKTTKRCPYCNGKDGKLSSMMILNTEGLRFPCKKPIGSSKTSNLQRRNSAPSILIRPTGPEHTLQ